VLPNSARSLVNAQGIGALMMVVSVAVTVIVSLVTPPPPPEVQNLVEQIR
jgi:cation/acetate symporter